MSEWHSYLRRKLNADLQNKKNNNSNLDAKKTNKKRSGKKVPVFFTLFMLVFVLFSGFITKKGVEVVYNYVYLKNYGIKTTAIITDIDTVIREHTDDDGRTQNYYEYFEIATFMTENHGEISARLYVKGASSDKYNLGDEIEISYNIDDPTKLIDASTKTPLFKGLIITAFGLLTLFVSFGIFKTLLFSLFAL